MNFLNRLRSVVESARKNPVLVREVRTRMRGSRAFIALTVHLAVLSVSVLGLYLLFQASALTRTSPEERRLFGKALFGLVIGLELLVVSFNAPSLSASAISGERERQTYDLLRVTLLSPYALVLGKYASGLIFVLLLLFTSVPVQAPAFLLGGVTAEEIVIATLVLLVTAMTLCAAGIFASSLFQRTLISTVASYGFSALVIFGLPLLYVVVLLLVVDMNLPTQNPGTNTAVLEAILYTAGWLFLALTPTAAMVATEVILMDQHQVFLVSISLSDQSQIQLFSPWIPFIFLYLLMTVGFLWGSVRLVRRKER